jgi:hypothetical protein
LMSAKVVAPLIPENRRKSRAPVVSTRASTYAKLYKERKMIPFDILPFRPIGRKRFGSICFLL